MMVRSFSDVLKRLVCKASHKEKKHKSYGVRRSNKGVFMAQTAIRRALLSVTNKDGICDFAAHLVHDFGVEIISTGGTARVLAEAGIPLVGIEDYTGSPEMMGGRVKTLHPRIHGGLLCRRSCEEDMRDAKAQNIPMIDLVCTNLYEFEKAVAQDGCTLDNAIEHIDIGGPSMLRSAAKNFKSVTVICDPHDYEAVLAEMGAHNGATTLSLRQKLAYKVFDLTSRYDQAITSYLAKTLTLSDNVAPYEPTSGVANQLVGDDSTSTSLCAKGEFPSQLKCVFDKKMDLRYGENPHQQAAFYCVADANEHSVARARQLQGKELSYNNLLDTDAAWSAVCEFDEPAVVILKHQNPCGSATALDVTSAYKRAFACDPKSAFGGIIAANREVDLDFVTEFADVNKQFVEVLIAPSVSDEASKRLSKRKNLRVLVTGGLDKEQACELKSIGGGLLVQTRDCASEDPRTFKVVTKKQPTQKELEDLLFAWKVCKTVKSNAILIAKDKAGLGLGCGQPNRVDSAIMACERAHTAAARLGVSADNFACASDAFFPFRDDVDELARRGVSCIIQPGGSIRDEECIAAADEHGIAMVFTAVRHFRH